MLLLEILERFYAAILPHDVKVHVNVIILPGIILAQLIYDAR